MATRIIIDAGHGGYDKGASYKNRLEKDDNLNLALRLGDRLLDLGYDVYYTRESDIYQVPLEKTQIANDLNADYFISIHRNSSSYPNQFHGVQTLIYDENGIKLPMAQNINQGLVSLGFQDDKVEIRPDLSVLKHTKMPALLIEAGFLNSDIDNIIFDQNIDQIAQIIAEKIDETIQDKDTFFKEPIYRIQVGLYQRYGNALQQYNRLTQDGYLAIIVPSGDYFAVQAGNFKDLEEAAKQARRLRSLGYETLILAIS